MTEDRRSLKDYRGDYLIYARKVLTVVSNWTGENEIPRAISTVRAYSQSGWSEEQSVIPNYWLTFIKCWSEIILQVPDVDTWADILISHAHLNLDRYLGTNQSADSNSLKLQNFQRLRGSLLSPIIEACEINRSLILTDEEIEKAYVPFEVAWSSEVESILLITPLAGTFQNPQIFLPVQFSPRTYLVSFKTILKNRLWNHGKNFRERFNDRHIGFTNHCILVRYLRAKSSMHGNQNDTEELNLALKEIKDAITSLRLLSNGTIGGTWAFEITQKPKFSIRSSHFLEDFEFFVSEKSIFDIENASIRQNCQSIYSKIASEEKMKQLKFALGRFNRSFTRQSLEDVLIDCTIVLESTVLYGHEDELTYRLGLRSSALISDLFEPSYVQSMLSLMYEIRSQIVHEGKDLEAILLEKRFKNKLTKINSGLDFEEFTHKIKTIIREILKKYIERISNGETMDAIKSSLDTKILNGLRTSNEKSSDVET